MVAALWVAVDTCVPYSMLRFRLAPPPAFIGTFPKLIYWRWVNTKKPLLSSSHKYNDHVKPQSFTLQDKWISFIYSKLILLPWCICTKHMAKCFSGEIWRQLSIFSLRRETPKNIIINDSAHFEQCIHWKELSNVTKKNSPKMLIICMQEYKTFCLLTEYLTSK